SISTRHFSGDADGRVTTLHASRVETVRTERGLSFEPVPGSEFELPADLVLLAMGFVGPERNGLLTELGVRMTERGTVWRDDELSSVRGRALSRSSGSGRSRPCAHICCDRQLVRLA